MAPRQHVINALVILERPIVQDFAAAFPAIENLPRNKLAARVRMHFLQAPQPANPLCTGTNRPRQTPSPAAIVRNVRVVAATTAETGSGSPRPP